MKVRMALALLLIFLLMNSGVFGQSWSVIYKTTSICALRGSTVNMSCSYTYPQQYQLTETFWVKRDYYNKSLTEFDEYKGRVEYIEDRQNKTAILRLNNVTENDEKEYCFRLITATEGQRWHGQPGIQLNVSALQVQAPQEVMEKETVNLTCRTSCDLTDTFIWYKNGQALNFHSDILQLQSVRSDSGSYSCAVRGHEHLPSPAVRLSVMYPPQNTSVSVSPCCEIVSGDSVTLICSSDSNPPALNFSWFKENETSAVGSGQSFSALQSGRFYCQAHNPHGSQRSDAVTVTVHPGAARNVIVIAATSGGLFIIIIIIILYIIRKGKKRRSAIHEYENDSPRTGTYAALDPTSRSPEVYSTLTTVHPRPAAHQMNSSEYENHPIEAGPVATYGKDSGRILRDP